MLMLHSGVSVDSVLGIDHGITVRTQTHRNNCHQVTV